jgi:hypothetical protein
MIGAKVESSGIGMRAHGGRGGGGPSHAGAALGLGLGTTLGGIVRRACCVPKAAGASGCGLDENKKKDRHTATHTRRCEATEKRTGNNND